MEVAQCVGVVEHAPIPDGDAFAFFHERCSAFQRATHGWDGTPSRKTAVHHLDLAVQEASEAWDLIEGGWKHHKRAPRTPDRGEFLMELVDVLHFIVNAMLYVGHDSSALLFKIEWDLAMGCTMEPSFYHGDGAHGSDWEKTSAAFINELRTTIVIDADRMRDHDGFITIRSDDFKFIIRILCSAANAAGFTYNELVQAFADKNAINFKRLAQSY